MRQLSWTLFSLLVLTACDPDSEPVGQGEGGGEDSGSGSDPSETTSPTSSGSVSAGSATASDSATSTSGDMPITTSDPSGSGASSGAETCEESDCAPCPDETTLEQYCDGDTWVCECLASVCDLATYVDAAAAGKTPRGGAPDCGTLTLEDTDAAYAAARDCVLAASAAEQSYRVVAERQDGGSVISVGYAGAIGFVYGESYFLYSSGGGPGDEFITRAECAPDPVGKCTPGPDNGLCLTCRAENVLVCWAGE